MKPRAGTAFDHWAVYYDLIHSGLPGDVEFYLSQARTQRGEVLELGIGTGRMALPLIVDGFSVTGIDNSAAMLALCESKMEMASDQYGDRLGKLTLIHADARAFSLGRRFDLIIMPYRGFMHLLTPEDQRRCLACVRKHLTQNGLFVMDTWLPNLETLNETASLPKSGAPQLCEKYRLPDEGLVILHYQRASIDQAKQLIVEEHIVRETNLRGRILNEISLPMTRSWATQRDMERLLARSGFKRAAVYGDFQAGPVTPATTEIIWALEHIR